MITLTLYTKNGEEYEYSYPASATAKKEDGLITIEWEDDDGDLNILSIDSSECVLAHTYGPKQEVKEHRRTNRVRAAKEKHGVS